MIPDELVKEIFQRYQVILEGEWQEPSLEPSQFYRGITHNKWQNASPAASCDKYLFIFDNNGIIPRYCFSCYKIIIEPRNVVELFKLMLIFNSIQLPNDNTRKCMVELRQEIPGSYKGLIYCQSLDEAREILFGVGEIIAGEISPDISITQRRGCSEFSLAYPEFSNFDKNGTPTMEYKEEWQTLEDLAKQSESYKKIEPSKYDTYTPKEKADSDFYFTYRDVAVMLNWLKYAASIGDTSYLNITNRHILKLSNLNRPPVKTREN